MSDTVIFFHHVCIQTNCYIESVKFYRTVLGFELVQETPGFHGRDYNTWLKLGEFYIELQTGKNKEILISDSTSRTGIVHMCFQVDDFDKYYNIIKEIYSNFKTKNGKNVYEVEGGKLFKIIAPEGTIIEIRNNKVI